MSKLNPLEELYQEEIYILPPRVEFILSKPFDNLSENEVTLLTKLANAIKLGMANIKISNSPESIGSARQAIIFGEDILPEIPLYEITNFKGTTVIKADALDVLDGNDANKKILWKALKGIFSI